MNLSSFLSTTKRELTEVGLAELTPEIRWWLSEATGESSVFFASHSCDEIEALFTRAQLYRFSEIVNRRKRGEPLAYILGHGFFYGRSFLVGHGVLIPRPDSEKLLEVLLSVFDPDTEDSSFFGQEPCEREICNSVTPLFFYDLCTGSGCLGITALLELRKKGIESRGCLTDISPEAIGCARENARRLGTGDSLIFRETDLIPEEAREKSADFILINPPYIPQGDISTLMPEVSVYEPESALSGGPDGLLFYRRILEEGISLLKDGGLLFAEHGYDQGESVQRLFRQHGLYPVRMYRDYGGNPRVTVGRR